MKLPQPPRGGNPRFRWLFSGPSRWGVLTLAALLGCQRAPEPAAEEEEEATGPVHVTCAPAHTGPASDTVTFRGLVGPAPDRDALVAPTVAGRIVELLVLEGAVVHRGDPLARVETPDLVGAVAEADAELASARAAAQAATSALARARKLLPEGIVSRREVEDAQERSLSAAAALRSAQARQHVASQQGARARLEAPIDGTVIHVLRQVGELVDATPGTPIVEIADPTVLELRGEVPAADLVRLSPQAEVTVEVDAFPGVHLPAQVVHLSPTVDPTTSLGGVRVRITDSTQLRIGMAGEAVIRVATRPQATLVPQGALRRSPEGEDEVVVCAGPVDALKASVRTVELGVRVGDEVEVRSGVKPGEQVVDRDVLALEEGTALVLAEAEGEEAAEGQAPEKKEEKTEPAEAPEAPAPEAGKAGAP